MALALHYASFTLHASMHVVIRTAGWIKIRLGTEIGLDPGHIVLNADLAAP